MMGPALIGGQGSIYPKAKDPFEWSTEGELTCPEWASTCKRMQDAPDGFSLTRGQVA